MVKLFTNSALEFFRHLVDIIHVVCKIATPFESHIANGTGYRCRFTMLVFMMIDHGVTMLKDLFATWTRVTSRGISTLSCELNNGTGLNGTGFYFQ